MSLNIPHYPNISVQQSLFFVFTYNFKIDLNQAVKEKLGRGQELTNALALKIFKQIKLESDILSFLTKPIVFIPLSVAVCTAGLVWPETGVALVAIGIMICALGGGMLGTSIREPFDNFLSQLSQAYSNQSKRAAEYIKNLESSNQEFLFTLA